MDIENHILDACNEVGCLATEKALKKFDADGSPIKLGETKLTSQTQMNAPSVCRDLADNHHQCVSHSYLQYDGLCRALREEITDWLRRERLAKRSLSNVSADRECAEK